MQFEKDADVVSADGKNVGKIDRVVLDPESRNLTHLIVRKGMLLTHDRVVPREAIRDQAALPVTLNLNAEEVNDLPELEESYYRPLAGDEQAQVNATYPGMVSSADLYVYPAMPVPPIDYTVETQRNIPDQTVALKTGARVKAKDGEHVGNVETVITSPSSDKITHFVISHGMLLKEQKLVPMSWIDLIDDEEVKLNVPLARIEKSDPYKTS